MSLAKRLGLVIVTVVVGCAFQVAVLAAQTCGPVNVTSQAEADAFNCAIVQGNLVISGGDITHLNGLSELTTVGGDVFIFINGALRTLEGLAALTAVGFLLSITGNAALRTLEGLAALTAVGGPVQIANNAALTQFCGLFPLLSNDDGIGGGIQITGNGIDITEADILDAGPCE